MSSLFERKKCLSHVRDLPFEDPIKAHLGRILSSVWRACLIMAHFCQPCDRFFSNEINFRRHTSSFRCVRNQTQKSSTKRVLCEHCQETFASKYNLNNHKRRFHPSGQENLRFRCGICTKGFATKSEVYTHRTTAHEVNHEFQLEATAHNENCKLLRAFLPENVLTLDQACFYLYEHMKNLIQLLCIDMNYFRINFTMNIDMEQLDAEGNTLKAQVFPFRGFGITVSRAGNSQGDSNFITREVQRVLGDIERNCEEFLFQASGWIVRRPVDMEAEVVRCKPIAGGVCGLHEVRWQYNKGIQIYQVDQCDSDGQCFYYAIAAYLLPKDHSQTDLRTTADNLMSKGGFNKKPVKVSDLNNFEEINNDLDLAINVVYKDEEGSILPVRASRKITAKHQIALLLFDVKHQHDEEVLVGHYALIRDPNRLFAKRTLIEGKRYTAPVFFCYNCFNTQNSYASHISHVSFCHEHGCQKIRMPEKGDVLSFEEQDNRRTKEFHSAFSLYYDFEALQVDPKKRCCCPLYVLENTRKKKEEEEREAALSQKEKEERAMNDIMLESEVLERWQSKVFEAEKLGRRLPKEPVKPKERKTKACPHKTFVVKEQPAFAYSYILIDRTGKVREKKTYVGADAPTNFIMSVLNLADKYLPSLSPGKAMDELTEAQIDYLQSVNLCYLCSEEMCLNTRVYDHDHLTGEFLGIAHSKCNLQRRETHVLTCFAHNFTGYDGSYLMSELHKFPERIKSVKAIPLNMQKMKMVVVNSRIRFMDSFGFLSASLAKLVTTLVESKSDFPIFSSLVQGEDKELLLRKGIYPYGYATSIKTLEEKTSLPDRGDFFNDVNQKECDSADYQHAQKVWNHFRCQSMIDYTAIYIKSDVYLLADVMFKFRNDVWENFGLDLHQYLSLPHIAMDAMLKLTGVEIELLVDQEMSSLLRHNIRGGHSFVNLRHALIEQEEEEDALTYLDCNNLYGEAMRHPLPQRDFRWMSEEEVSRFSCDDDISWEDGPGYILEVDLEYPDNLHLAHNSFPLAPESITIGEGDLSPYGKACLSNIHNKTKHKAKKLSATFKRR